MKKGDEVDIYNMTMSGKRIKEGKAKLIKKLEEDEESECWNVLFPGDEEIVSRWIAKENDK